jgi:hypothetical protein
LFDYTRNVFPAGRTISGEYKLASFDVAYDVDDGYAATAMSAVHIDWQAAASSSQPERRSRVGMLARKTAAT